MNDYQAIAAVGRGAFPCVPHICNNKGALWFGKWCLNITENDVLKRGPYDTLEAACAAIEATGLYTRRNPEPASGPHFDRK